MRFRGASVALAAAAAALATAGSSDAAVSAVLAQASPTVVRISWRSDLPAARTVVELGLTADYGIWSPVVSGAAPAVTITGLEPATAYRFRIRGAGSFAGSFTTPAIPAVTSAGISPTAVILDGQPFFPRMVFQQCPSNFGAGLAAGINLFVGAGCGAGRFLLEALGGRAYGLLDVADRGAGGRGLIGFAQPDEADEHGGLDSLEQLPPSSRSGRISLLTLTNHFFSAAEPLPQGRVMYPDLVKRAEFVGFDLYPLAIWCRRRYTAVFDAQREVERLAAGKPTFQWIEAGTMTGCNRFVPTPESVEAETWLAIAGGARGIGYFPDTWAADIAARITALNRRILALAPALTAPERPVAAAPSDVRAGARMLSGATYVIAVNASSRLPATARLTLPGFSAKSIRVYGEQRTLPVRNGVFADRLAPLQTRIYVAPPVGAP